MYKRCRKEQVMWKLEVSEGYDGPRLSSIKKFGAGWQVWRFDPNLGTPEELAEVESARDKFCQNIIWLIVIKLRWGYMTCLCFNWVSGTDTGPTSTCGLAFWAGSGWWDWATAAGADSWGLVFEGDGVCTGGANPGIGTFLACHAL